MTIDVTASRKVWMEFRFEMEVPDGLTIDEVQKLAEEAYEKERDKEGASWDELDSDYPDIDWEEV